MSLKVWVHIQNRSFLLHKSMEAGGCVLIVEQSTENSEILLFNTKNQWLAWSIWGILYFFKRGIEEWIPPNSNEADDEWNNEFKPYISFATDAKPSYHIELPYDLHFNLIFNVVDLKPYFAPNDFQVAFHLPSSSSSLTLREEYGVPWYPYFCN